MASVRNPTTSLSKLYVTRVDASFAATVAFTAASQQLFVIERFNTATPSGGTAYTAMRHSSAGGQLSTNVVDARASTTAALTVTSVVFEGNQIPILGTASPAVSTTHMGIPLFLAEDPIILLPGEGLAIRNVVVWPAAGTGVLTALVSWTERS